ncbi:MAG: amidase family protein [Alphaproteobacteria bacterium]
MTDSAKLSMSAALRAMDAGELTAETLLGDCLARVDAREKDVLAWVAMDREAATANAKAADAAGRPGALGGLPVAFKDIIDTAALGTEYNSVIYKGHRPTEDASAVTAVKEAGGFIMGKTVTTTFAHRNPGPTRNPHNPGHSPGGSSSGSAAAVADFMVPLALGTQTGGSVLRPGAYCGILAYKPAFDAINFGGTKQISASLDTLGFYARSLDDLPIAGAALQGRHTPLAVGDDTAAPKIALVRTTSWDQAQQCGRDLVEDVFEKLGAAGAATRELDLPPPFPGLFDAHTVVGAVEPLTALAWEIENDWDGIPEPTRKLIEEGREFGLEKYVEALALGETCRRQLPDVIEETEIILTLPAPGEAPEGLTSTGSAEFNRLWTFLHVPCLHVPVDRGPTGLPIGIQLVSRRGSEAHLLATARWIARKLDLDLFG